MSERRSERPKTEDVRVFLALGLPIFVITVSLVTLIVFYGPARGQ